MIDAVPPVISIPTLLPWIELLLPETVTVPAERIAVTQRLGDFRTSMLADVEARRPLELAPQLGAVAEIAQRLDVPAPFVRSILGLTRLLSA